ncbi:hypothetical protein [Nodosilinea nodulosa]|uniref:hypothetical protein n=1 Tax=Nodosilinea nodulosa TaxID=416001 RepID=UPI0012D7C36F|nr:hypothetical protein [Nodosilinea nodulosa]
MKSSESYDDSNYLDSSLDEETIQKLRCDLIENPHNAAIQLGKYGVTVGQASEIHIGDIINHNLDQNSIDMLVSAIKSANDLSGGAIFRHLERRPLEILKVDSEQIKQVNSDLRLIENFDKKGYLSTTQQNAFTILKQEIHSLNDFNYRLDKLHSAAKSLLEEGKENLVKKIESLRIESEKLLNPSAIEKLVQERRCKQSELKILEDFIQDLEESAGIAVWIDRTRKALAKRFGREALKAFPDIESSTNPEKVSYFCFSIYQFLEQISHCLKWGRHDILDSPEIPLVFDHRVYAAAFSLIKDAIDRDMSGRFDAASRKLASDCIDYLISQLPFYEQE